MRSKIVVTSFAYEIVSWYASPITHDDENFLGVEKGNGNCQQVLECLNMLLALRTWKSFWCTERVRLEVRSDNIGALTLVMSLKEFTKAMNQVARELALDLGDAAYKPEHRHTHSRCGILDRRHIVAQIFSDQTVSPSYVSEECPGNLSDNP